MQIVKMGTVDQQDVIEKHRVGLEIYTKNRLDWCPAIEGAGQTEGAMGS